ncbi:zinc finger protein 318 isoform X3 [Anomalospiza imberbis]|uniref:zinc finger protein 318 isoform X3 n=1 Tax=Anomalospiza imberbis TaxID=187417 RepID=UPI00358F8E78
MYRSSSGRSGPSSSSSSHRLKEGGSSASRASRFSTSGPGPGHGRPPPPMPAAACAAASPPRSASPRPPPLRRHRSPSGHRGPCRRSPSPHRSRRLPSPPGGAGLGGPRGRRGSEHGDGGSSRRRSPSLRSESSLEHSLRITVGNDRYCIGTPERRRLPDRLGSPIDNLSDRDDMADGPIFTRGLTCPRDLERYPAHEDQPSSPFIPRHDEDYRNRDVFLHRSDYSPHYGRREELPRGSDRDGDKLRRSPYPLRAEERGREIKRARYEKDEKMHGVSGEHQGFSSGTRNYRRRSRSRSRSLSPSYLNEEFRELDRARRKREEEERSRNLNHDVSGTGYTIPGLTNTLQTSEPRYTYRPEEIPPMPKKSILKKRIEMEVESAVQPESFSSSPAPSKDLPLLSSQSSLPQSNNIAPFASEVENFLKRFNKGSLVESSNKELCEGLCEWNPLSGPPKDSLMFEEKFGSLSHKEKVEPKSEPIDRHTDFLLPHERASQDGSGFSRILGMMADSVSAQEKRRRSFPDIEDEEKFLYGDEDEETKIESLPVEKPPVIEEREKLKNDREARQKKLYYLKTELDRLRKQQGEMLRKKRREKDGHKDPLLVEVNRLQENIMKEIAELHKESDAADKKQSELDKVAQILGINIFEKPRKPSVETKDSSEKNSKSENAKGVEKTSSSNKESKTTNEKSRGRSPKPAESSSQSSKHPFQLANIYEYYDAGNHWCKDCNTICGTMFDFFTHMHNKKHRQTLDPYNRPWASKTQSETKQESIKRIDKITVPAKGSEFLIPITGYYCQLCHEFFGDQISAEQHVKSHPHNEKYKKYIDENPLYEERRNLDRQAGLAVVLETERRRQNELKRKLVEKQKEEKDEKTPKIIKKEEVKSIPESGEGNNETQGKTDSSGRKIGITVKLKKEEKTEEKKEEKREESKKESPSQTSFGKFSWKKTEREDKTPGAIAKEENTEGNKEEIKCQSVKSHIKPIEIKLSGKTVIPHTSPWIPVVSTPAPTKILPNLPVPTMIFRKSSTATVSKPPPLNTFLSIKSSGTTTKPLPVVKETNVDLILPPEIISKAFGGEEVILEGSEEDLKAAEKSESSQTADRLPPPHPPPAVQPAALIPADEVAPGVSESEQTMLAMPVRPPPPSTAFSEQAKKIEKRNSCLATANAKDLYDIFYSSGGKGSADSKLASSALPNGENPNITKPADLSANHRTNSSSSSLKEDSENVDSSQCNNQVTGSLVNVENQAEMNKKSLQPHLSEMSVTELPEKKPVSGIQMPAEIGLVDTGGGEQAGSLEFCALQKTEVQEKVGQEDGNKTPVTNTNVPSTLETEIKDWEIKAVKPKHSLHPKILSPEIQNEIKSLGNSHLVEEKLNDNCRTHSETDSPDLLWGTSRTSNGKQQIVTTDSCSESGWDLSNTPNPEIKSGSKEVNASECTEGQKERKNTLLEAQEKVQPKPSAHTMLDNQTQKQGVERLVSTCSNIVELRSSLELVAENEKKSLGHTGSDARASDSLLFKRPSEDVKHMKNTSQKADLELKSTDFSLGGNKVKHECISILSEGRLKETTEEVTKIETIASMRLESSKLKKLGIERTVNETEITDFATLISGSCEDKICTQISQKPMLQPGSQTSNSDTTEAVMPVLEMQGISPTSEILVPVKESKGGTVEMLSLSCDRGSTESQASGCVETLMPGLKETHGKVGGSGGKGMCTIQSKKTEQTEAPDSSLEATMNSGIAESIAESPVG